MVFLKQFQHFENGNLKLSIVSDIENKFMVTEREMKEKVRSQGLSHTQYYI